MSDLPKILFVDDEPDLHPLIEECLESICEVESCREPYSALARVNSQDYRLVISDYHMPGMSGIEMIGRMHQTKPDLPCLVLTAFLDPEEHKSLILKGTVVDVIQKPVDLRELAKRVKAILA